MIYTFKSVIYLIRDKKNKKINNYTSMQPNLSIY